jgi:hypothetical protein
MIEFILYRAMWGSGGVVGSDVMKRHNIDIVTKTINEDQVEAPIVSFTPDQLAALLSDPELDVLITKSYIKGWKLLALDKAGKKFSQR